MNPEFPFVSIIIPVKNEARILGGCLASLKNMDYPRECFEIIIADSLSTDNTQQVAKDYGARIVLNNRQLVVSGRNLGFSQARGELVGFTDADCVVSPDWLKNSIKYFQDEKVAGVGGVTLFPAGATDFEKAVNTVFSLAGFFSSTSHLQKVSCSRQARDIAGCNAIYRKEALAKVMPVDENLLTAEDVWMNLQLGKLGYKFMLGQDVILWHHRRSRPRAFFRQIYRFAIGRLQVGRRDFRLLSLFHILAVLILPLALTAAVILFLTGFSVFLIKATLILLLLPILAGWFRTRSFPAAMYMPLALILFFFAWPAGFLRELIFPIKDVKGK